ncbi:putative hydrolase or acyltransferase of alpha/beta superfamily [Synechococcus sp. PCC 7502]|uniref:alpha/beta hydrolase n=1 Tax=Synechococcus sp. PCC 7502 TaxID=1173263 RepID=UPI00029FEE6F|nr:alpha/beta hydrolase [Synechococcus sp. PCC 7502]AFY72440.1 putative hydrolase or acyltransferase of alpha/beta superfamily [Synechococcus sp. PCC 7502]
MPDFLLYAQHGWADHNYKISCLGQTLATPDALVVAPNLGWWNTWWKIAPLIQTVETIAIANFEQYPHTPIRIVGHSMGGLIWLEILNRYPQWWKNVHSLVLVGSPVGGSKLAKILDPLAIAIGADLAINRMAIAEKIAFHIKTLSIAGDINGISDGTVTIASTQFSHGKFKVLKGINHPRLKNHSLVARAILDFWAEL